MDLEKIERAVAAYRALLLPVDIKRLEFFQGIWRLQDNLSRQALLVAPYQTPDPQTLKTWYWEEKPILMMAPLAVSAPAFVDALKTLSSYLAEQGGFTEDRAESLKNFDWQALVAQSDLNRAGYAPTDFLESCKEITLSKFGADETLATLVVTAVALTLRCALAPVAEQLMDSLSLSDENSVNLKPTRCPVCGGRASLASIGQVPSGAANGRALYCNLCGTSWEFERIRCAGCGSRTQDELHYFHLEGDEGHRLHLCKGCNSYLRTVFLAQLAPPFSFEVEDVVMAQLDHIANDPRFTGETGAAN